MVTITNYYKVNRNPGGEWKLFAHIAAPQNGQLQMVGNHDHDHGRGEVPASRRGRPGRSSPTRGRSSFRLRRLRQIVILVGFWHDNDRLVRWTPAAPGEQARTDGHGAVLAASFPVQCPAGAAARRPRDPPRRSRRTSSPRRARLPSSTAALNDPAWEKAPSTGLFTASSMTGAPTHTQATAKLLYDPEFLYVAFDVQDEDIWGNSTSSATTPSTARRWWRSSSTPTATAAPCLQRGVEVSLHNVIFDAAFEERRKDLDKAMLWDSGMESAVQIDGTLDNSAMTSTAASRWR